MKRIIALLLAVMCLVSVFGCAKKSELGGEDTNADGTVKDIAHEDMYNFLVMGHDRQASLTDVVMLVSFDTEAKSMTIMQLPRDTYIEMDDYSYHKLNGLYNHCVGKAKENGSENAKRDGAVLAGEYLAKTLGIKIHHSLVMDLDGFGAIVDAVGGVYMYVPYTMEYEDPAQNLYINLPEGYNTLDGNEAEQFVRFRSGLVNADLGRVDAQKMFMTAFFEAVKNNISITNVATIATAIIENVETDMKNREIVEYATAFLGMELSDITMMTVPGAVSSSYYVVNKGSVAGVLNESYNIYVDELTDDDVDKDVLLCDEGNTAMMEVYEKPASEFSFEKHNAQDVSDEDIYVPLK